MPVESALRGGHDQHFGLIETLLYQPGQGCVRAERHIARMANSAQHFAREFDQEEAKILLSGLNSNSPKRVRLYLDEHGRLTMEAHPFVPIAEGSVWRIAIARSVRLDSANQLLAHKTSLRRDYEAARADHPADAINEVILLNERGHVCEGTITSVFIQRGGKLLTPPLSDGLLAGVLRAELIDNGDAIEHELLTDDLEHNPLYVGNSLRGLIPARLVRP